MPTTFGTTFDQRKRTLDQLEEAFLAFLREERREPEHDGEEDELVDISEDRIVAGNEGALDETPQLVRTRTTTVHDYADPNAAVTTDPPVSQAQRGAMHAAAQGSSNIGIPQSVGKEFANADPGGKLPERKGTDGGYLSRTAIEERASGSIDDEFELSPDGGTITHKPTGKSCSIEDAMRIIFSDGSDTAGSMKPETHVSIDPVNPANVPSAKLQMPKTSVRGEDDTMQGGALGGAGGNNWNMPKWPKQEDNGGMGGKILGQLLKYKAGDRGMRGGSRGTVDNCGWKIPSSDYGTSEGARKRGPGGGTPVATPPPGWQPRDLSKAGYGGAAAAKNYPEGFVQGVGPATSTAKPAPKAAPAASRPIGAYGKGASSAAASAKTHPMGIYDRKPRA